MRGLVKLSIPNVAATIRKPRLPHDQLMSRVATVILTRVVTPLTAGLFLVAAVSGTALFFHVGTAYFYDMHGWLSLLLLLPVGFHLWRNWASFLIYVRR